MSFQTSSHFDSTTLLIVKTEIDNIIKNVENGISNLIEDESLPYGIEDALLNIQQCSHVFSLIEQPQLATLSALTAQIMQKIIQDSQKKGIISSDVEAMSEATTILKRYLDFLCIRETRAAQFLTPIINKLQIILQLPLTREGVFIAPFLQTIQPNTTLPAPEQFPDSHYVLRLYKLSLLNILQDKETALDYRALALCGNYFSSQATGTPSQQYWRFVQLGLQELDNTIITEPRLRVLINIERQQARLSQQPEQFEVSYQDYADILALCLSQDSEFSYQMRNQLGITDELLSDSQLEILSRQLYGPDLQTIQTVVNLLSTQIADITKLIEAGQHIHSEEARQKIADNLNHVSKVLDIINLNDAAQQLNIQAQRISNNDKLLESDHASTLMNALLYATNSLQILEQNFTPTRLKTRLNNINITLEKVEEAQNIVCSEARLSLQHVYESVLNHSQTQDVNDLNAVPSILRNVSGAALFLESTAAQQILLKAAYILENNIISRKKLLSEKELQLLALAITSADFYFEQIQNHQPFIEKSIDIGQRSINELEKAVA